MPVPRLLNALLARSSTANLTQVQTPDHLPSRELRLAIAVLCILAAAAGSAAAQSFKITPASIAFHTTVVGTETGVQTVTVTNTGTAPLTVTSFSLTPFNVFILEYGWARTLQPGEFGNWAIRFKPVAAGAVNGNLTFTIQGVSQPQVVNFSGTGTTTLAAASVSPNVIAFPLTPLGSTSSQTITITNTGGNSMHLASLTLLPPFSQTGFSTEVTIAPKKTFSFQVSFTPMLAISYANALSLGYDVVPDQTVSLAGTGVAPSALAVSSFPTLPTGSKDAPYLATLAAAGGTPPYIWSLSSGKLPTGISLSGSGALTGSLNVNTTGNYSFTVQVADSSPKQQKASLALTLPVVVSSAKCSDITWDQAGTSNPLVDLPDLGTGSYLGAEGGLYPGGSNVPPASHEADGLVLANGIVPLDANGNPDPNGKYALLSIGVSISRTMFSQFNLTEAVDPQLSPHLVIVNGAIDGTQSTYWRNFNDGSWQTVLNFYLPYANVTPKQVVAVWMMIPHSQPSGVFPSDMDEQTSDVISAIQNMQVYFPNLKLGYVESMHYGGYSTGDIVPEPYSYETGFAMQSIIADQINGDAALNYNPNNGPVMAPWLSWGVYDWANGMLADGNATSFTDGLEWSCSDMGGDGVHASSVGKNKDAALLISFFKSDETTTPWFLAH
jgi:hypothetical protein